MVEGRPAYQVGTSRQDDGLEAAEGTGNGSSKKEEPEEDKDLPGLLANIVLVILYGGFFCFICLGIAACDSCADTPETERNGKRRNCGILCKCIP